MVKITKNDYLNFRGIDLDIELKHNPTDNVSSQVDIFIKGVTEFVYDYMREHFVTQKIMPKNKDDVIKRAILHQIEYVLLHGDITMYNPDRMPLLAPNALRVLKNAGLANMRSL